MRNHSLTGSCPPPFPLQCRRLLLLRVYSQIYALLDWRTGTPVSPALKKILPRKNLYLYLARRTFTNLFLREYIFVHADTRRPRNWKITICISKELIGTGGLQLATQCPPSRRGWGGDTIGGRSSNLRGKTFRNYFSC